MTGERGAPATGWTATCPAKVNLRLRILAREETGFHQIETLFQAIGLHDRVEVRPGAEGISLDVRRGSRGPAIGDLGDPDDNTVMRAARAFYAATGIAPAVSLVLTKSIPAGTGLGGASSDAAGALAALNALHGAPLAHSELIALGGRVGADVPFFSSGAATALAWGRGDRLLRLPSPPSAPVVLAIPRRRVSTAAAYREASARLRLPAPPALLAGTSSPTWASLAGLQCNDFEAAVFASVPELAAVRAALADAGAAIARLTGSGTAVFGVFRDSDKATAVAGRVRRMKGVEAVLVVPTLTAAPPVRRSASTATAP